MTSFWSCFICSASRCRRVEASSDYDAWLQAGYCDAAGSDLENFVHFHQVSSTKYGLRHRLAGYEICEWFTYRSDRCGLRSSAAHQRRPCSTDNDLCRKNTWSIAKIISLHELRQLSQDWVDGPSGSMDCCTINCFIVSIQLRKTSDDIRVFWFAKHRVILCLRDNYQLLVIYTWKV